MTTGYASQFAEWCNVDDHAREIVLRNLVAYGGRMDGMGATPDPVDMARAVAAAVQLLDALSERPTLSTWDSVNEVTVNGR